MTQVPDIERADVIIVGAGIMGASLAYFLARAGVQSLVLDRAGPAAEASGANAGMVSPSSGIPGKTLPLSILTAELYDQASRELNQPIRFQRGGRLLLAQSLAELAAQEEFARERQALGLDVRMLYGREVQEVEPILSDRVLGAAYAPDDGQIDPFQATVAYLDQACHLGASFRGGVEVDGLLVEGRAVCGVIVGGRPIRADWVVLAAGAWSGHLAATAGVNVPVVPGRGQMLVSTRMPPLTSRVLRTAVIGMRQMVQGNLVFGSEVEYAGFDKSVAPTTIARYCRLMIEIIPALAGVRIARAWAGLRPMTPDNLPILGEVPGVPGLLLLTGHGRTGMTCGPASALALAEIILHRKTAIPIQPLSISRFAA